LAVNHDVVARPAGLTARARQQAVGSRQQIVAVTN